ncbi:MAG: ThuA domain-containing protein [Gammaproteobacteria bacterium]|nr:ThuA domain-containing protein [Gammaproteobacteria bacterium]
MKQDTNLSTRNVLLTGGIDHPFEEASTTLVELLNEIGVESVVTTDVAEAVEELATADLFTIYACRWRMLDETPAEPGSVYELPEQNAETIENFVEDGGSLLGLHTACICFDTWYEYKQLLGGVWRQDRSFHPPHGRVEVRPVDNGPRILEGISAFKLDDEIYHDLDIAPDTRVLLEGRVPDGVWQPIAWTREVGDGRVFYDALGHDGVSLQHPDHARLLRQGVRWLLKEEG